MSEAPLRFLAGEGLFCVTIGNLAISIYRLRKMPKRSGHQITHPTAKWRTRAQNSLYELACHCVTVS